MADFYTYRNEFSRRRRKRRLVLVLLVILALLCAAAGWYWQSSIIAHMNGTLFLISGEISHVNFRLAR